MYNSSNFQILLLALFMYDKSFFVKWFSEVKVDSFKDENKAIYLVFKDYFMKFKNTPNFKILKEEVLNKYKNDKFKNFRILIRKTFKKIRSSNISEIRDYVENNLISFIKSSNLKEVLPDVLGIIDEEPDKAYNMVEEVINKFRAIRTDYGVNYFNDVEIRNRIKRLERSEDETNSIGTLIIALDNLFRNRGISRGKLCCVSAPYQLGKTTFLIHIAKAAVLQGFKVIFISFEESESEITQRLDSAFTGISINKIASESRIFRKKIFDVARQFSENIYIYGFPVKGINVNGVDLLLECLKLEKDFNTDLIVVDNLDSIKSYDNHKGDRTREITEVWTDFRALLQKRNMVGWTPSHINRPGIKSVSSGEKEFYTGDDISADMNKLNICDFHMTLNLPYIKEEDLVDKTKENKDTQDTVCFIDKNRMGRRYISFDIVINFTTNSVSWNPSLKYKGKNVGFKKMTRR